MKVIHLPTAVGGNAWNLSSAEKKHGIDSTVLNIGNSKFGFGCDIKKDWDKNKFTYPIKAYLFYKKAIHNYDIFHFNFGRTIFDYKFSMINMIDLIYLKRKNKKIVVTYQGSDSRLAKYSMDNYDINYFKSYSQKQLKKEYKVDKRKIQRFKKVAKYADIVYATNPDLLNVLPKNTKYRPYTKLQIDEWTPSYSDYNKEEICIVHAPTNRVIKGTDIVIRVIESLKKKYKINFLLIEDMSNDKAIELLKKADIVIDQLYIGFYGGLAVESMALGKPVVAYIREDDLKHIPKQMRDEIPIINANESNLEEVLIKLFEQKSDLNKIALNSRRFVENWHDSMKIATDIISDYKKILESGDDD